MKSEICKKRETPLPRRRFKFDGSCVRVTHQCKYCKSCKNSCRRPGTYLIVFQTEASSRACSTTSPTAQVKRCKASVWTARKKWSLMQQDSELLVFQWSRIGTILEIQRGKAYFSCCERGVGQTRLWWEIIHTSMNDRFLQWVTIRSAAILRFVPWMTMCFLIKERIDEKNHLKTRSKNNGV